MALFTLIFPEAVVEKRGNAEKKARPSFKLSVDLGVYLDLDRKATSHCHLSLFQQHKLPRDTFFPHPHLDQINPCRQTFFRAVPAVPAELPDPRNRDHASA